MWCFRPCLRGLALWAVLAASSAAAFELEGEAVQGGLMFGQAEPGASISLDGQPVLVAPDGRFVIGFNRDDTGSVLLEVRSPGGETQQRELAIAARQFNIERVDGLPPKTVTPDPASLERIREEARLVSAARTRRDPRTDWADGFVWPASGRLSGFYGSQRILNGTPGNPHYGVDVAAPTGSPVLAPAPGIITLVHPDMYYSGGTIILDHGLGLSSTFLHLSEVLVEAGQSVQQGDLIGRIGATGRATGPHLDWRMNWLDRRVDPHRLVPDRPPPAPAADGDS
jgi:murein DD-endopeptidase MepM/ murein hydrolase activator NlpD